MENVFDYEDIQLIPAKASSIADLNVIQRYS